MKVRLSPVLGKTLIPEIKILFYIFFVVFVSAVSSLKVYIVIFFLIFSFFFLKVPFNVVKSGWIPVSIFLIFTFVSNVLNQHGKIIFSAGAVLITEEGFNIAAIKTLRIFFMIAGAKILVAISKTEDIIHGFGRLLGPFERFGLPVKDFFFTMGLTLKCFPILKSMLYENYHQHIKSADIKGVRNRARAVSMFLLPMFAESIKSPEKLFIGSEQSEKAN